MKSRNHVLFPSFYECVTRNVIATLVSHPIWPELGLNNKERMDDCTFWANEFATLAGYKNAISSDFCF